MHLRGNVWAATFFAVAAAMSIANGATRPGVVNAAYEGFPVTPPTPNVVFVCHGFGCKYRAELDLTGNDRAKRPVTGSRQILGGGGAKSCRGSRGLVRLARRPAGRHG